MFTEESDFGDDYDLVFMGNDYYLDYDLVFMGNDYPKF